MEIVDSGICGICGAEKAVLLCDGCGKPLCAGCRRFDIWCYGCGHGDTKAFCERCYNDPSVNLYLPGDGDTRRGRPIP